MRQLHEMLESNGGAVGLLGIAVGLMIPLFEPPPIWKAALFAVALVLFAISLLSMFGPRRSVTANEKKHELGDIDIDGNVGPRSVIGHGNVVDHSTIINQAPKPSFQMTDYGKPVRQQDGTFLQRAYGDVVAAARLTVRVTNKTLLGLDVLPVNADTVQSYHEENLGEGWALVRIQSPFGRIQIDIRMSAPRESEIDYSVE